MIFTIGGILTISISVKQCRRLVLCAWLSPKFSVFAMKFCVLLQSNPFLPVGRQCYPPKCLVQFTLSTLYDQSRLFIVFAAGQSPVPAKLRDLRIHPVCL